MTKSLVVWNKVVTRQQYQSTNPINNHPTLISPHNFSQDYQCTTVYDQCISMQMHRRCTNTCMINTIATMCMYVFVSNIKVHTKHTQKHELASRLAEHKHPNNISLDSRLRSSLCVCCLCVYVFVLFFKLISNHYKTPTACTQWRSIQHPK